MFYILFTAIRVFGFSLDKYCKILSLIVISSDVISDDNFTSLQRIHVIYLNNSNYCVLKYITNRTKLISYSKEKYLKKHKQESSINIF